MADKYISNNNVKKDECKLVDCTVDGKCSRCGGCCPSMLPVTDEEYEKLEHLAKRITPHDMPMTPGETTVDFTCPFMMKSRTSTQSTCAIYNDRPAICRHFTCAVFGKDYNPTTTMTNAEAMHIASAKHHNLWNLFGKTGIADGTNELMLDDAPIVTLVMDDDTERELRIGTFVEVTDQAGDKVRGLFGGIDKRGLAILTLQRELVIIPCDK